MSRNSRHGLAAIPRYQQGVTLVVVLILLVILSVLGVAILRSTSMQDRMSANMRDRSLAVQGAETAMRFAQQQVLAADVVWEGKVPLAGDCATSSICPTGSAAAWRSMPAGTFDPRLQDAPEYWIEYLGIAPGRKGSCDTLPPSVDCQSPMFRINARSNSLGRANVILQSNVSSRTPTPGQ